MVPYTTTSVKTASRTSWKIQGNRLIWSLGLRDTRERERKRLPRTFLRVSLVNSSAIYFILSLFLLPYTSIYVTVIQRGRNIDIAFRVWTHKSECARHGAGGKDRVLRCSYTCMSIVVIAAGLGITSDHYSYGFDASSYTSIPCSHTPCFWSLYYSSFTVSNALTVQHPDVSTSLSDRLMKVQSAMHLTRDTILAWSLTIDKDSSVICIKWLFVKVSIANLK